MKFATPEIEKLLKHCTYEDLQEIVDRKYIHKEMGGQRDERHYPLMAPRLDDIYHKFGLSKDFVDYFYEYYNLK